MPIKINEKMISIPPYISANWSQIASLHMKGNILVVSLIDGDTLHIPGLDSEQIALVFQYHTLFLENEHPPESIKSFPMQNIDQLKEMVEQMGLNGPVQFSFGDPSLGDSGFLVEHNPDQANAPDLPPEILEKIKMISQIIAPEAMDISLPKAEKGCNCFHCQISRALSPAENAILDDDIHEVTDLDLQFQQWEITQIENQLFSVVNRLDTDEKYNVFLGEPVGCTCGQSGCEHILAVLKS